ncbi:methyltransferase domain-containing protein [Nonomuraea sp. NN258]|uniref:class I SAM-dependent methyltransferase n=1 Tax=Nonomuraea antri TaxID=2730852 RepID=UPI0015691A40|nr:class I SAM-dependent methyltransferase [Nonomuraea antri]NRQ35658.1 methyltransferase domain-containing protein [Nonomuraea antri]
MPDYYRDLASDYHWLFPDPIVKYPGILGGTSPGSADLVEAVAREVKPGAAVLDCACGIGTDAMALAHRGFRVTASDGSPEMVAEAARRLRTHAPDVEFVRCLWQDLPATLTREYELVLCLGNSLGHAGSHEAMVRALRGMRGVLSPTGTLVVDSRNWELLYRERPRVVVADEVRRRDGIRSWCVYVWTIPAAFPEPCQAEVLFLLEHPDGAVTHRRHPIDFQPFTPAQLEARLEEAGFTVTGGSYHPQRPRYALVARPN